MGRILTISFLLLFVATLAWGQGQNALNNQAVIDMVGLGLSDDVVIEKIRSAPETNFDTGIDALKALKAAKVSDAVIKTMINPKAAAPSAMAYPGSVSMGGPPSIPGWPPNAIVAYKRPDSSFLALAICPAVTAKVKGGGWGLAMTGGFGKVKTMSVYRGSEAPARIGERRPVFFVRTAGQAYMQGGTYITLTRLIQKEDHREMLTSSARALSQNDDVEKARVELVIANASDGFVSATPKDDLPDGEYMFTLGAMGLAGDYDFGIGGKK